MINNPDLKVQREIIEKILKKTSNIIKKNQKGTINIIFINKEGIKKLSNDYRKINKETDVLSFNYEENFDNSKDDDIIGEIVMCIEKIKSQAIEYNHSKEDEFYKLLIHSILHILGYDHEKDNEYIKMDRLEKIIYKEVFEK